MAGGRIGVTSKRLKVDRDLTDRLRPIDYAHYAIHVSQRTVLGNRHQQSRCRDDMADAYDFRIACNRRSEPLDNDLRGMIRRCDRDDVDFHSVTAGAVLLA